MSIERISLGQQVYHEILTGIVSGRLAPLSRLSDSSLADMLGVSRTPVREALLRLSLEQLVDADQGRGFTVRPLSVREVDETYPILAALECLALRLDGPVDTQRLQQLKEINAKLARAAGSAEQLLVLDDAWHTTLLAGSHNAKLGRMIDEAKRAVRRYEYAYMRQAHRVLTSVEQHDSIVAALSAGQLDTAVHALEAHWMSGMQLVRDWLERESSPMSLRRRAAGETHL
ncbi:MAG: GntR family transcriptional regulator [Gemmatimonadota bacterium]